MTADGMYEAYAVLTLIYISIHIIILTPVIAL